MAMPTDPDAYPQAPFDLVKEAVVSGLVVAALVIAAALAFGAPWVKPLTIRTVARTEPKLFLATAARELGGLSTVANYGPPYNHGTEHIQALGFFHPQTILGVTTPIDPAQEDVLVPLHRLLPLDPGLAAPLATWQRASAKIQRRWVAAYLTALDRAPVHGTHVTVSARSAGPVPVMLSSLHRLALGGLLSGALDRTAAVYRYDVAPSLLFLQGKALHQMARRYDLLGSEWGIMHDEAGYPGPWWLTPYTALYQIPPYSTSPAGDLMAAYTMLVVFLVLLFLPFIPGLRELPRRLRVYRLIWRDWYREVEGDEPLSGTGRRAKAGGEGA